jgi:nitrile hydratase accessory protein
MSGSSVDRLGAYMEGTPALPRRNGELVFEEPWESRAFGAAVALAEAGAVEWEGFRQLLIAEIAAWQDERGGSTTEQWSYYERWLAALERLLVRDGILDARDIEARTEQVSRAATSHHEEES